MKKEILLVTVLFLLVQCGSDTKKETIIDYVGQAPPGSTPVIFAPGIISVDSTVEHGSPAFSPDGTEIYWQSNYRQPAKETGIFSWMMKRENNKWSKPIKTPMGRSPVFTPDGKQLHYRLLGDRAIPSYSVKENGIWSAPKAFDLSDTYREIKSVSHVSFAHNRNIYFRGYAEGFVNSKALYRAEYKNEKYQIPELLPFNINIPGDSVYTCSPHIAPDESYLIFASRKGNPPLQAKDDLFISFRNNDGSWSNRIKLGPEINTDGNERFPRVSPDGKYLFFTRFVSPNNEEIFWVSADFIYEMKDEYLKKQ